MTTLDISKDEIVTTSKKYIKPLSFLRTKKDTLQGTTGSKIQIVDWIAWCQFIDSANEYVQWHRSEA
jgi:hypothetical protein